MDLKFMKEHFNQLTGLNAGMIQGKIRGIALYFTGLGHKSTPSTDMVGGAICAENNILYLLPFYNPWCRMNSRTVGFIDALVDTAMQLYDIPANAPVPECRALQYFSKRKNRRARVALRQNKRKRLIAADNIIKAPGLPGAFIMFIFLVRQIRLRFFCVLNTSPQ